MIASTKAKRPTLTPKQEKFAQLRVELGDASKAYRLSYNASRMKPATVNRAAKALMDNPKIAARIDELRARLQKRHEVTVDTLTRELVQDRKFARKKGSPAAAVSATLGKAKLHGLLKDRHEHTGAEGAPIKFTLDLADDGDEDGA